MSQGKSTTLKAATPHSTNERTKAEAFAAYVARVTTDERTPQEAVNVLGGIAVALVSNSSAYAWHTDAEGLRFMLPRLLANMNEEYADGIMDATLQAIDDLLPSELGQELFRAANKERGTR